jgi:AraC-like DNA-binding protein
MASALNISRVTLFKAFKEQTGNSPLHYLQEFRINESCRLLRENQNMSIADICKYSAFPNDKYFIRIFKRYIGLTPREYQKQLSCGK